MEYYLNILLLVPCVAWSSERETQEVREMLMMTHLLQPYDNCDEIPGDTQEHEARITGLHSELATIAGRSERLVTASSKSTDQPIDLLASARCLYPYSYARENYRIFKVYSSLFLERYRQLNSTDKEILKVELKSKHTVTDASLSSIETPTPFWDDANSLNNMDLRGVSAPVSAWISLAHKFAAEANDYSDDTDSLL